MIKPSALDFSAILAKLQPHESVASYLARTMGPEGLADFIASLDDSELELLVHDLDFWSRANQIPPKKFLTCFFMCGRGFGKTFAGARWVIEKAKTATSMGAIIGPTTDAIRKYMVNGPSGILTLSPPWFRPQYEPSKRLLTWPNGVQAVLYPASEPERLRGCNAGWCWADEITSWKGNMAALDQIPLFLRVGSKTDPPQLLITTTPKPLKKLADLLYVDEERTQLKPGTVIITGSSLDNAANLAPDTVREWRALARTQWGRQEVLGELMLGVSTSLFGKANWQRIDADPVEFARTLDRIVVAIDPSQNSDTNRDETGIIVAGVRTINGLKHVYVLEDLSLHGSPREWGHAAVKAYVKYGCAAIVAEVNTGGAMVEANLKTASGEMGVSIHVKTVRAKEGKSKRAEPVSALSEAGRITFVGHFPKLERQLQTFSGINGRRDDRCDAMLWGIHDLAFTKTAFSYF